MIARTLFCILSVLAVAQVAVAEYNPLNAVDYFIATIISTGDMGNVTNWTCARCADLPGYQPYAAFKLKSDAGEDFPVIMIYNSAQKLFVTAFPGTGTVPQLIIEQFTLNPVDYELHDIPGAKATKYFYTRWANLLRESVLANLTEAYDTFSDYQFVFTGHSLGAAISTQAGFDAVASGIIPSSQAAVYNFGSPRVGNQALAQAIEQAVPEFWRITHWQDPVPHIPLCVKKDGVCSPDANFWDSLVGTWPAWHVANEVFYNEDFTSYKICNGSEDPTCADQFRISQTTWKDHFSYMGISLPVKDYLIWILNLATRIRYLAFF